MPLFAIVIAALVGLFSVTSFATFKEIKRKKKKKVPKFLQEWHKIQDNLKK